jgi:chromosome segregation ATPase
LTRDSVDEHAQEHAGRGEGSGQQSADRYDFDRLERSVGFLIEEHERLSGERAALLEELVEREHRIATLEARLKKERTQRTVAVEGVDKLLARLEQLKEGVAVLADTA